MSDDMRKIVLFLLCVGCGVFIIIHTCLKITRQMEYSEKKGFKRYKARFKGFVPVRDKQMYPVFEYTDDAHLVQEFQDRENTFLKIDADKKEYYETTALNICVNSEAEKITVIEPVDKGDYMELVAGICCFLAALLIYRFV